MTRSRLVAAGAAAILEWAMEEQAAPRVTALVISRNQEDQLRRCVQSLDASTDRETLEILVVDDGSLDGTSSVPDEFPGVISLKLPKRFGWTRAVNIGLRTAKGDLVCLVPASFEVGPDTVARMADVLEASEGRAGAVSAGTEQAWSFPTPQTLQHAWKTGELAGAIPIAAEQQQPVDYPRGAIFLTRRELLRAMHYLDERFGDRWADLEMCWRIRGSGKQILAPGDIRVRRREDAQEDVTQLEWTDSANGVATWIGLHHGTFAGLGARLSMAFYALGRGKASVFMGILTGTKIDGNHE